MDRQLHIKTSGRDDSHANDYNYPYEPTDYVVLERIVKEGYITKNTRLVDYGCGKGRVSFYLAYETGCKAVGVEYDERMYRKAIANHENFPKPYNVSFECVNAKEYVVPEDVNCCYFFNPFSKEVLASVLQNIKDSYLRNPREILLIFYYPSYEYIGVLTTDDQLDFIDEIDCSNLFSKEDKRERVLIFGMGV